MPPNIAGGCLVEEHLELTRFKLRNGMLCTHFLSIREPHLMMTCIAILADGIVFSLHHFDFVITQCRVP